MSRIAVVLFNLGGPDNAGAVQPFLFNLFNDRAIINWPQPFRGLLARFISSRRAPITRQIYARIGNASPLRANTNAQANALRQLLGRDYRVFVAMRYWHPYAGTTAAGIKAWKPDRIILLPLYPQFSSTTTASSFEDWKKAAARIGLTAPTREICCYPTEPGFIQALVQRVEAELKQLPDDLTPRVLLSAHGLPKKIIARGDPYQWQVEATAAALRKALNRPELDLRVCYQSRVGPLAWLTPSTEEEIHKAGQDGVGLVVAPIAFVSEHSETLVELDMDYRKLAREAGVPVYRRAATAGTAESFIAGLARLVHAAADPGARICPQGFGLCLDMARPAQESA